MKHYSVYYAMICWQDLMLKWKWVLPLFQQSVWQLLIITLGHSVTSGVAKKNLKYYTTQSPIYSSSAMMLYMTRTPLAL